jgi:KDO2-lipid IV(A) lauroyltransferase
MLAWKHYLEFALVRLLLAVVQVLPLSACTGLARWLAWLAADVIRFREKVVDENLRHTFPDWTAEQRRDTARRMWEHLVLMICEVAQAQRKIHETNWRKHIHLKNNRTIARYLLEDRPTVMVSGHFGNFEVAAVALGILGFPSYAIARMMDNPLIERLIRRFRESKGQFVLPKDGSADQIQRVLAAGRTISLLGDQHAGTKGVWVDFLGRPAACHKALALFTLTSAAPMIVLYCRRGESPLQFEIDHLGIADPEKGLGELSDVRGLTQWYNDRLAEIIRRYPHQYWWVHRRWKDKPVRQTAAKKARAA